MLNRRIFIAGAASAASAYVAAEDAGTYPSRPISLVVPFPPGGSGDLHARFLAQSLSSSLGQIVVVNRPGGAGILAAESVKNAQPDGYTLLQGHIGMFAINPGLYPKLPYEPERDFQPITMLFQLGTVIVVKADSEAKSLEDLVSQGKTRTEGITYGSIGLGTASHLLGEQLRMRTGSRMIHVPFQGAGPVMQNLLAGRIDFSFDGVSNVKALMDSGKVRALAIASEKRHPQLPGVPTTAEAGYQDLLADFWIGLFAPRNTPSDLIAKLNRTVVKACDDPTFRTDFTARGFDIATSSPSQLADQVARDKTRLGAVIRSAGVKLE